MSPLEYAAFHHSVLFGRKRALRVETDHPRAGSGGAAPSLVVELGCDVPFSLRFGDAPVYEVHRSPGSARALQTTTGCPADAVSESLFAKLPLRFVDTDVRRSEAGAQGSPAAPGMGPHRTFEDA